MKKKLPRNVIFFSDEIYGIEYLIVVSPSHSKFRKLMKEYLNIEIEKDEVDCGGQFHGLHDKKRGDLGGFPICIIGKPFRAPPHPIEWLIDNRFLCDISECFHRNFTWWHIRCRN